MLYFCLGYSRLLCLPLSHPFEFLLFIFWPIFILKSILDVFSLLNMRKFGFNTGDDMTCTYSGSTFKQWFKDRNIWKNGAQCDSIGIRVDGTDYFEDFNINTVKNESEVEILTGFISYEDGAEIPIVESIADWMKSR